MAEELRFRLRKRKESLWRALYEFASLRDAHGVHDMAVEIQGIEVVEKLLQDD